MRLPRSLPNQITIARIVLAALLFVILHLVGWAESDGADPARWGGLAGWVLGRECLLLNLCAAIFFVAAISDILDGQIARAWNLTTDFGRIADPFADKVIVSGAFVFLVPIAGSGVSAWMVVAIVARESLVDGIRGFAEARGIAFGSSWWGKGKMVLQSATIVLICLVLANGRTSANAAYAVSIFIYSTLAITFYSGLLYVLKARTLLRRGAVGEKVAASPSSLEAQHSR